MLATIDGDVANMDGGGEGKEGNEKGEKCYRDVMGEMRKKLGLVPLG